MDTITCPKCGTENPADAMNCKECRVNLQWVLENWVNHERMMLDEEAKREQAGGNLPDTKRNLWWIKYILLVVVFIIVYGILPANQPGDIVALMTVPILFLTLLFLFIIIDVVVGVVRWIDRRKKSK